MNILISACLLGVKCRYDGTGASIPLAPFLGAHVLIPVCPEQLGGLATPREPAERVGEHVINKAGGDVTAYYERGAGETLRLAKLYHCRCAVLKERSPSCGSGEIYDGTFSGIRIPGKGITAALLEANGIRVSGESCLEALERQMKEEKWEE